MWKNRTRFVDEILHYVFYLDFADCLTDKESSAIMYDLMQTLELKIGDDFNG